MKRKQRSNIGQIFCFNSVRLRISPRKTRSIEDQSSLVIDMTSSRSLMLPARFSRRTERNVGRFPSRIIEWFQEVLRWRFDSSLNQYAQCRKFIADVLELGTQFCALKMVIPGGIGSEISPRSGKNEVHYNLNFTCDKVLIKLHKPGFSLASKKQSSWSGSLC